MGKRKRGFLKTFGIIILAIILVIVIIATILLFSPFKKIDGILRKIDGTLFNQENIDFYGDFRIYDVLKLYKNIEDYSKNIYAPVITNKDIEEFNNRHLLNDDLELILEDDKEYRLSQNEIAVLINSVYSDGETLLCGCKITKDKFGLLFDADVPDTDDFSVFKIYFYLEYDIEVIEGHLYMNNYRLILNGSDQDIMAKTVYNALKKDGLDLDIITGVISKAFNEVGRVKNIEDGAITIIKNQTKTTEDREVTTGENT